jgi:hypothetical protein
MEPKKILKTWTHSTLSLKECLLLPNLIINIIPLLDLSVNKLTEVPIKSDTTMKQISILLHLNNSLLNQFKQITLMELMLTLIITIMAKLLLNMILGIFITIRNPLNSKLKNILTKLLNLLLNVVRKNLVYSYLLVKVPLSCKNKNKFSFQMIATINLLNYLKFNKWKLLMLNYIMI